MSFAHWAAALAFALSLSAPATAQTPVSASAVVTHHAALVHAAYADTHAAAVRLQTAIRSFTAAPSPAGLAAARQAWLDAREFYGQTEAFRFYGGPIDDQRGPEGRLNAWPMDESYVDALIHRRQQPITPRTLSALNEKGGEENVATGWHAIEFLLWGPDRSDTGPGDRSFEDYVDGKAPDADRRRQYLNVVTRLLVTDLDGLVRAWAPGVRHNYRARFERGGDASVRRMLVGLGSLSRGELAGERLEVALASQDQEDEQSCFSDNTHRDAVANARGIRNVWLGRYEKADGQVLQGPGLNDLVASRDAALAERIDRQLQASVEAAESIPAPFDQAIRVGHPGRDRIEATIRSLTTQSDLFVAAGSALGIRQLTLARP